MSFKLVGADLAKMLIAGFRSFFLCATLLLAANAVANIYQMADEELEKDSYKILAEVSK